MPGGNDPSGGGFWLPCHLQQASASKGHLNVGEMKGGVFRVAPLFKLLQVQGKAGGRRGKKSEKYLYPDPCW